MIWSLSYNTPSLKKKKIKWKKGFYFFVVIIDVLVAQIKRKKKTRVEKYQKLKGNHYEKLEWNKWVTEWVNEWTNERMNDCIYFWLYSVNNQYFKAFFFYAKQNSFFFFFLWKIYSLWFMPPINYETKRIFKSLLEILNFIKTETKVEKDFYFFF